MKKPRISVIIPTLNEAKRIPMLLADLNLYPNPIEILVVDCGSSDCTELTAKIGGARFLKANECNRGYQMHLGASIAKGEWLFFLHADSRLHINWFNKIIETINNPFSKNHSWYFDLKICHERIDLRILEIFVSLRSRFLQLPYGDQGLLVSKYFYKKAGGYSPIHLMEDFDLVTRLSKHTKLKSIGIPIYTDGRRWQKHGALRQAYKNYKLRQRWKRGESSEILSRDYYR